MNNFTKIKAVFVGLAISTSLLQTPAQASEFTLSSSSGIWTNIEGGEDITGIGTNEIFWGIPIADGKSGLVFDGVGQTSFNAGETFKLGNLTYINSVIPEESAPTAVNLETSLFFPDGGGENKFNFTFTIDETPDIEPCQYPGVNACSDKISIAGDSEEEFFSLMGKDYSLQLLGFGQNANDISNEFISEETSGENLGLFAQIVEVTEDPDPVPVPEPTTLGGSALFGLYLMRRYKAAKNK